MILKDTSLEDFIKDVKENNKKIIVYGAGVIGKITAPYLLNEQGVSDRVLFFADADRNKQGKDIIIGDRFIEICSPERITTVSDHFVILITGSRYQGIVSFLNQMRVLDEVAGYILPQMLVKKAQNNSKCKSIRKSDIQLIPKTIHYCWFGGNEISEPIQRCIDSWKKFCPDFEIVQWNEKNYDINKYLYMKQAYENKKWAFVSDVARLDILHQYGGIYLDTDVELVKGLDELLYQPGFCCVEKWGIINTGGGCGAVPKHPVIEKMLEQRKTLSFENEDGSLNLESSGSYESLPLLERGFLPNNRTQEVDGMSIYSSDFFHPFDYMSRELCITENTYGIHRFFGSWT